MTTAPRTMRFADLTIAYDERVLEPRPWTALQSRWAAELAEQAGPGALLELCSGAGHIGLLAAALTGRELVAVDVDPVACSFLRANAEAAGLAQLVEVREARLQDALAPGEQYAVALADPPWVSTAEIGRFPADPTLAIDGGVDGLAVALECVAACRGHLTSGGSLLVQLGDDEQADRLVAAVAGAGWHGGERRAGEGGVVVQLRHEEGVRVTAD